MIYEARVTGVYAGKYWVNIPAKFGTQDVGPIDAAPTIAPAIGDYVYVGELPVSGSFLLLTGKDPSPVPVQWADIAGKPATFPSTWATVSGKPTTFAPSTHTHLWADITDKPSTFTPSTHTHFTVNGGPAVLGLYSSGGGYYSVDGVTKMAINLDGGITSSAAPSIGAHLANKTYVDAQVATRALSSHAHTWAEVTGKPTTFAPAAHTHAGSDITSGTISDARIANATASLDGLLNKAHYTLLANQTEAPTASTLMRRSSSGRSQINTPYSDADIANKAYVDAGDALAVKQGGDNGSAHLDTVTTLGQTSTTSSANVTPANGYPINGTAGELDVRPFHATRPAAYLIQEWTQWSPFRKWGRSTNNATAATPVWTAWVEITSQVATSLVAGLMSAADKAKLDTAAYDGGPGSIAWVNANGYLKATAMFANESAAQYNAGHALTRKDYVDDNFLGSPLVSIGTAQNLNNYTTTGRFLQGNNNAAAGGTNYPAPFAGRLLVDGSTTFTWQEYTVYSAAGGDYSGTSYTRGRYNSTWSPWQETLTARADGLDTWARMTITDSTNFKPYAGVANNLPEYSKVGREVRFEGVLECLTAGWISSNASRKVGTIPAAMAPSRRNHVVVIQSSNADRVVLEVTPAGDVNLYRYGPTTNASGAWLPISTGWRV